MKITDKAWLASLVQEASDAEAAKLYKSHYDSLCGCSDKGHPMHEIFLYTMYRLPTFRNGFDAWDRFKLDLSDPDWDGHKDFSSCSDPEFTEALMDYISGFIEDQHECYDYRDDRY